MRGALPADPTRPRIQLGPLIQGEAPPACHYGHLPQIGMLGNDLWGDCTPAACAHLAEAWTFFGQGREVVVTEQETLDSYAAMAGFSESAGPPGNNPTDLGCLVQTGLEYMVSTGIAGCKAAAFGQLDLHDTNQWQQAMALFGPLILGVGVTSVEETQFDIGEPWTLVPGAAQNPEDHCVVLTGYQPGMYWCQTWGAIQGITAAWFEMNVWEIWCAVSPLWVSARSGLSPEGATLAQLGQLFTTITGRPSPFAAPAHDSTGNGF
jgi:hypothetical protein